MTYADPNVTSFVTLIAYNNDITQGLFALLILVAVFAVAFISMKQYAWEKSFGAASFLAVLAAILLWVMGLIGIAPLLAMILISAVAFAFLYASGTK